MTIDAMYEKINMGTYRSLIPYDRGEEQARLNTLFYRDACESLGLDPLSNRSDKIFSKAWADGHSAGHHEVYGCLVELVDFLSELEKLT